MSRKRKMRKIYTVRIFEKRESKKLPVAMTSMHAVGIIVITFVTL